MSNDIKGLLSALVGEDAVRVADILLKNAEITDEKIVELVNEELSIKDVRKALYKLNDQSLARYRRQRDPETGYFVYWWKIERERLREMILQRRRAILKILKQRLEYEEENLLYKCENCNSQPLPFDDAFETEFLCKECNNPLVQLENEELIEQLRMKINELEKKIDDDLNGL